MSTISQRIHRSRMPGYWAVEIQQSDAAGPGKQYLCHARDDRSAAGIAGRLMGSALTIRGFRYYWIDEARLERSGAMTPALGDYQPVAGPAEWAALMTAHNESELAAEDKRGGA